MPTYLLAVVVTDYEFIPVVYHVWERPVLFRVWTRKENLPYLNRTMAITPKLMQYMEDFVQQPYSLPKLDFMSSPASLTFSAMENWGLIIYRFAIYLCTWPYGYFSKHYSKI